MDCQQNKLTAALASKLGQQKHKETDVRRKRENREGGRQRSSSCDICMNKKTPTQHETWKNYTSMPQVKKKTTLIFQSTSDSYNILINLTQKQTRRPQKKKKTQNSITIGGILCNHFIFKWKETKQSSFVKHA